MSAWVVGLGLSAGYLINKNISFTGELDKSIAAFQGAAQPATSGVTSAEVRQAYKSTDFVKYGSMNEELSASEKNALLSRETAQASAVQSYDGSPSEPIQGVVMQYDRLGV